MKCLRACFILLLPLLNPELCFSGDSAFTSVRLNGILETSLPKNWAYLDKQLADTINVSSEAKLKMVGINLEQGNNDVLVAANSVGPNGKNRSTLRISIRKIATASQEQLEELSMQPKSVLDENLKPFEQEVTAAILKIPEIKTTQLRSFKIDHYDKMYCMSFTYDQMYSNDRQVVVDNWICPLGDKLLKLSTSIEKGLEPTYRPIIEYVRSSLKIVK